MAKAINSFSASGVGYLFNALRKVPLLGGAEVFGDVLHRHRYIGLNNGFKKGID